MTQFPLTFVPRSCVQTFAVPTPGLYRIEAFGAQGGAGGGPGGKGARIGGTFFLREGEQLCLVVGRRGESGLRPAHATGGGGGGSFVWRGTPSDPRPNYPLLAAGGGGGGNGGGGQATSNGGDGAAPGGRDGQGGESDRYRFRYSGGGGAGWRSAGSPGSMPTLCGGGDHWAGGEGANHGGFHGGSGGYGGGGGGCFFGHGSGGGGGYGGGGGGTSSGPGGGGGGSFNAGAEQLNVADDHEGDGQIVISFVEALTDTERDLPASVPEVRALVREPLQAEIRLQPSRQFPRPALLT